MRGRLERSQHGLISRSTEVRVLLPHPSRKRTATYINGEHELILGYSKKMQEVMHPDGNLLGNDTAV